MQEWLSCKIDSESGGVWAEVSFLGPHFFELELFFRVGGIVGLVNKLKFEVDCVKTQFYMLQSYIFLILLE